MITETLPGATGIAIKRRGFLKLSIAVSAGVVENVIMTPLELRTNQMVWENLNRPANNAGYSQSIENSCKDTNDPKQCAKEIVEVDFPSLVVIGPPVEEALFRGLPSLIVSGLERKSNPMAEARRGIGRIGLTRRELIGGIVTSVIFGAGHNITSAGFDTQTIPASQTIGGFSYWYLQRKFGIVSNTVAHMLFNLREYIRFQNS